MIAISFFVIWLRTRNHRIKYSPKKNDKECTVLRLLDSNKVNSSTPILILKHECLIYLLFFLIQYWNYYWSIFYLLSFHIFFHYTCIMWAWLFRIELFWFFGFCENGSFIIILTIYVHFVKSMVIYITDNLS